MWIVAKSVFWTSLGIFLLRGQFITSKTPKMLGRILYWIGVPLQILALARRSDFSQAAWFPPTVAVAVLLTGLSVALLCFKIPKRLNYKLFASLSSFYLSYRLFGGLSNLNLSSRWEYSTQNFWLPNKLSENLQLFSSKSISDKQYEEESRAKMPEFSVTGNNRASKGSFVLASMLGNTGFIGLAIAPGLIDQTYWSWIVIYGVAHNILGSYGLGVVLANYFSHSPQQRRWLQQLRHIFTIPSLWAFFLGWLSQDIALPTALESGIQTSSLFVVPGAFLLIGMRLSTIERIESWHTTLFSTAIKISILPAIAGLSLTVLGLSGDARLALVLMSGMPTAFANVILAEEYNLDRQIAASSILFSTVAFPLVLPLWLFLFG